MHPFAVSLEARVDPFEDYLFTGFGVYRKGRQCLYARCLDFYSTFVS
jgi:hypothetical protein